MKKNSLIKQDGFFVSQILTFLFVFSFSSSADEYKPMIRYDRVWECLNLEGKAPNQYVDIKCMKFDGTEEINGKTYHRLVTFKKSIQTKDGYIIKDNVFEHEGYLREENGRVYSLVEAWSTDTPTNIGEWFGKRYIPQTEISSSNPEKVEEYILYDFNLKPAECYNGLTYVGGTAIIAQFKVISDNLVVIDGEECRILEVGSIDPDYGYLMPSHKYIEGIGAGESGGLNHHEYYAQPSGMWMHNLINRVFDMNGNVIFKNLEGCQFEDLEYESFSATDGVYEIAGQSAVDTPCYDIYGRRIAVPAKGQIYIQGGRKFIGK